MVAAAEFRSTGLVRLEGVLTGLQWFKQQGYAIPEVSYPGLSYDKYLEEVLAKVSVTHSTC